MHNRARRISAGQKNQAQFRPSAFDSLSALAGRDRTNPSECHAAAGTRLLLRLPIRAAHRVGRSPSVRRSLLSLPTLAIALDFQPRRARRRAATLDRPLSARWSIAPCRTRVPAVPAQCPYATGRENRSGNQNRALAMIPARTGARHRSVLIFPAIRAAPHIGLLQSDTARRTPAAWLP